VSFINKALEKAKSLHSQKVKPDPAPSQASPPPPLPHVDKVAGFAEIPGEIHYTHTRTVTVDMDRLRPEGPKEERGKAENLSKTRINQ
jgi:hypothetical protein